MKKVLLIVIDALSARHVRDALDRNRLPNFARLAELGQLHEQCTSIFPSITPAATASIITGVYPSQHGILGDFFCNTEEDRVYFFGDDIWVVLRKGCAEFFNDFLIRLNQELLAAETLPEKVEKAGKRAASLNYMIYRGAKQHPVNVPWLFSLIPGTPWHEEVPGPDLLCLGDFVAGELRRAEQPLSAPGGPFNRFGFQDDSTAALLLEMASRNASRDLTVAYFPDNDFNSHEEGPASALHTLEKIDGHLGELFDQAGGVESFLRRTAVVITGDHSQAEMYADEQERSIVLEDLLEPYAPVPPGKDWTSDDQLMICPNMRACQIYLRQNRWQHLDDIVARLLADRRIDQVCWRRDNEDGVSRFHVAKRDAGELAFWAANEGNARGRDPFGNYWQWEGTLAPVEGETSTQGHIAYGNYPNALERLANAFARPAGGDLWITACVGSEFKLIDSEIHPGGSHGAPHADDSTSPMFLAGAPDGVSLPEHLRILDATNVCLRVLGLPT